MMKVENPTSRDIAYLAGVSQATVSRALRNSPLVREETRDKIQQIAREVNYFVNRNAAGLRTHQSNTIALLLFDDSDTKMNLFFLSMLDNITRSAARLGYDVLVSLQQLTDDWHIEYQASHRADGLILLGCKSIDPGTERVSPEIRGFDTQFFQIINSGFCVVPFTDAFGVTSLAVSNTPEIKPKSRIPFGLIYLCNRFHDSIVHVTAV
jgi:hypothetical protein